MKIDIRRNEVKISVRLYPQKKMKPLMFFNGRKIYMEDKRKIAAKSGQLRYYTERKYEESPILKSMDPYR